MSLLALICEECDTGYENSVAARLASYVPRVIVEGRRLYFPQVNGVRIERSGGAMYVSVVNDATKTEVVRTTLRDRPIEVLAGVNATIAPWTAENRDEEWCL